MVIGNAVTMTVLSNFDQFASHPSLSQLAKQNLVSVISPTEIRRLASNASSRRPRSDRRVERLLSKVARSTLKTAAGWLAANIDAVLSECPLAQALDVRDTKASQTKISDRR